jgi:hypothetical protein
MWQYQQHVISSAVHKFTISTNHEPMTFRQIILSWETNAAFADFFSELLSKSSFSAFRWELPGLYRGNVDSAADFVLVDYPRLNRAMRQSAFAEYFDGQSDTVRFMNLSGDTELVVPCPANSRCDYSHLASFVRTASEQQIQDLWRLVGKTMSEKLGERPVWLSTAGMGVPWLHVRIATKPKYYAYDPYKVKPK